MDSPAKYRILHIDDHEPTRYVVRKILTQAGFEVIEAADGRDGLRLTQAHPDLVLLDVELPDISGFEVCRRIKADPRTASIPVVHLSSVHVRSEDRAEGLIGGADGYLTQPIDARELEASVRACLRIKEAERALRESERFVRATLDALPANLCVVDQRGSIVHVNEAWNRFAQANGVAPSAVGPGCNYLEVCRHAAGPDGETAAAFAASLGAVLRGERAECHCEYACHSGTEERWFVARVRRFPGEGSAPAVILHMDITERKRLEVSLVEARERAQRLSTQVLRAQEEERGALSRELHDDIGQVLTAAAINMERARGLCDESPVQGLLGESIEELEQAVERVRELALALRPSLLDDLGLVPALEWFLEREAARAGAALDFRSDLGGREVPPDLATVCYRVAQEAMTNVLRHAKASEITARLEAEAGLLRFTLRDDGAGFEAEQALAHHGSRMSLGLSSMRERATLVGGWVAIESAPGRGTVVTLELPLRADEAANGEGS